MVLTVLHVPYLLGSGAGRTRAQRFRGGLVSKDHRLWYHLTLRLRVTQKKTRALGVGRGGEGLLDLALTVLYMPESGRDCLICAT